MLIKIYTDGACSGNPGRGGYGTILIAEDDNGTVHKRKSQKGLKLQLITEWSCWLQLLAWRH